MKKLRIFFLILLVNLVSSLSGNDVNAQSGSGLYAGGPLYYSRSYSIDEIRNSGFTFLVAWTIHINASGDLNFNGEFLVCEDGNYVGEATYPNFDNDMALLKTAPTTIDRLEVSIGAWGSTAFDNVRNLINSQGTGSGSVLYQNFQALKNAIPEIDAINFDDESTYDASTATAFANMLGNLGYKVTLCPYTNTSFWQSVATSSAVDRVYVQCYAGGGGNSPCTWDNYFSQPVWPGMWDADDTPSQVESQMNSWQNTCGITGGWMWLYDDFDNTSLTEQYADAINNALDIGNQDCTGTDVPTASLSKTDETTAGANNGIITFSFPDNAGRTNLEFSLDGGNSFPVNVADNTGFYTFTGLAPGSYSCWIRWGDDDCPTNIGSITINAGSGGSTSNYNCGRFTITQSSSGSWTSVIFSDNMPQTPIVVVGPVSFEGSDASTIRVRNVSTTGFEVQIDEWDYLDGGHNNTETMSYMAVTPGNHNFNGVVAEAGAMTVDENWATQNLSQFSTTPVILATQVTNNGSSATAVRLRNVAANSFQVKVQEEEANDGAHNDETLHYIALSAGTGTFKGRNINVGSTGSAVDEVWYTHGFSGSYNDIGFLGNLQTNAGSDPTVLRYDNLTGSSVSLLAQEEQSFDEEVGHNLETVGWARIENISNVNLNSRQTSGQTIGEAVTKTEIYPNPFANELSICSDDTIEEIVLVDLNGKVLVGKKVNEVTVDLDLSELKPGIYFVSVFYENGDNEFRKVIKVN